MRGGVAHRDKTPVQRGPEEGCSCLFPLHSSTKNRCRDTLCLSSLQASQPYTRELQSRTRCHMPYPVALLNPATRTTFDLFMLTSATQD